MEVSLEPDDHARVADALTGAGEHVERLPDMLLCYTKDGPATLEKVRATGTPGAAAVLRRASLEDVFLRLTGRRLSD